MQPGKCLTLPSRVPSLVRMYRKTKSSVYISEELDLGHKPGPGKASVQHCQPLQWKTVFAHHQVSEVGNFLKHRQVWKKEKCPPPQRFPQDLWIYYVTWKRKLRKWMETKLLMSWPWNRKIILDYSSIPYVITRVLTSGRGIQTSQYQSEGVWERLNQPLLT